MTAWRIALAHGRASEYVSNDIGAISPGRWHCWQCFWRIGATSLEKVGAPATVEAPPINAAASSATQRKFMPCSPVRNVSECRSRNRLEQHPEWQCIRTDQ